MQILTREHFNRWYRLAPYYFSLLLIEIPFQAACAATYLSVSYWLTSQPVDTHRIILFMVVSIAASLTAQAWGFFIGATTPVKVSLIYFTCINALFLESCRTKSYKICIWNITLHQNICTKKMLKFVIFHRSQYLSVL